MWRQKFQFPHAIGSVDCSLIPIKKPHYHGDEFICRKGYAAFNMQATCDADSMFTSIDCSWAGSVHDARIWRTSQVQEKLIANTCGALLLGIVMQKINIFKLFVQMLNYFSIRR